MKHLALIFICWFIHTTTFAQKVETIVEKISRADQEYQKGNFKEAKELFLAVDSLDENRMIVQKRLASIYDQEENVPKALKYYLRLCVVDSLNGIYFRKAAKQFLKAGATTDALDYYEKAYQKNNKDFLTIKALADIYIESYDTLKAKVLLDKAIAYDAENLLYRLLSAKYHYKQSDYKSVISVLDSIKGQIDFNSYYSKMLGYCKLKEDQVDEAIFWLQKSLSDDSESEHVHYYLSEAYGKQGNEDASLHHLEQALSKAISERTGKYYRNMAKIYDQKKMLKEAIKAYEEAYRYDNDPLMLYFLARASDIYYADKQIAIRYYKRYLKSSHKVESYRNYAKERTRYLKEQVHLSKQSN